MNSHFHARAAELSYRARLETHSLILDCPLAEQSVVLWIALNVCHANELND